MMCRIPYCLCICLIILTGLNACSNDNPASSTHSLIGTWKAEVRNGQLVNDEDVLTFNSDMTYQIKFVVNGEQALIGGTYSVSDGVIVFQSSTGQSFERNYVINGNQLTIGIVVYVRQL